MTMSYFEIRIFFHNLRPRVSERLNFCIFEKDNTQPASTTDSFSLHGFIDCFNHHTGHAALLQSNAK